MSWLALLFPYRTHLEAELKQQRDDFIARLTEKDALIRSLRMELGEIKAAVWKTPSPIVEPVELPQSKKVETPQDWQSELNKLLQEEEDGIRSGRRIQEHEPSADDGT